MLGGRFHTGLFSGGKVSYRIVCRVGGGGGGGEGFIQDYLLGGRFHTGLFAGRKVSYRVCWEEGFIQGLLRGRFHTGFAGRKVLYRVC